VRVYNQGALYRVTVSANEVRKFMQSWPCSDLSADHGVSFTFDKQTGDLVDVFHPGASDGPALVALSRDAQRYAHER
jgi:hypothetical protein